MKKLYLSLTIITFFILISSIHSAYALQQVAGKIEVMLKPGESSTFEWGLLSDIEEEETLGLSASGAGFEFLSFPETVKLGPKELVYVTVTVTIPQDHPGGVNLVPVMSATEFGKTGGPTIINIQMQKPVNISIEENPNPELRILSSKQFIQDIKLGDQDVKVIIDSTSEVSDFALDHERNQISFNVSGFAGTRGSTAIQVSKVLEGPYNVMIDGVAVTDFETINDSESGVTSIKLIYDHSVHTITIAGTNVVPEFPFPMIGLVAALGSVIVILSRTRLSMRWRA